MREVSFENLCFDEFETFMRSCVLGVQRCQVGTYTGVYADASAGNREKGHCDEFRGQGHVLLSEKDQAVPRIRRVFAGCLAWVWLIGVKNVVDGTA